MGLLRKPTQTPHLLPLPKLTTHTHTHNTYTTHAHMYTHMHTQECIALCRVCSYTAPHYPLSSNKLHRNLITNSKRGAVSSTQCLINPILPPFVMCCTYSTCVCIHTALLFSMQIQRNVCLWLLASFHSFAALFECHTSGHLLLSRSEMY